MLGLESIIEPLIAFTKELWPIVKINTWERGIMMRNGILHTEMDAGLWFRVPFMDEVFTVLTSTTTMDLKAQSLVTKDGKNITVKAIIKYSIKDATTFLLEVNDQKDALGDSTMGVIARVIMDSTWDELRGTEINSAITNKTRTEAAKYGIKIQQVTLIDISPTYALRMYGEAKSELLSDVS